MSSSYKGPKGRTAVFGLIASLLMIALSGCIGGGGGDPKTTQSSGPTETVETTTTESVDLTNTVVNDPKRHFHHYWGDPPLDEVNIFYKPDLQLEKDAFKGSQFSCRSVGHAEFDLETDGNDASSPESLPLNPSPQTGGPQPRADVVFAGTSYIRVELKAVNIQLDEVVPDVKIFLRYKSANFNHFQPENGCGIELTVGEKAYIPVGTGGAADPPHQWLVSRWRFFVIAAVMPNGSQPLPFVADGNIHLEMYAINGGENTLDPAHPNLWGEALTYNLGCAKVDAVDRQIILWAPAPVAGTTGNPVHRPPQPPLADIKWQYGKIVPLLTLKVEITLDFSNSAPGAGPVELWYYGADTNQYQPATPVTIEADGAGTYEVPDSDGIKADPPYEDETLWRFMILPRPTQGENEYATPAVFQGSYQLCAVAHRDPSKPFD